MDIEFQDRHLQKVSRSFAFCIAQLPLPLRGWVGLSYLMCRILDTIEDAPFENVGRQRELFAEFESAVLDDQVSLGEDWARSFPPLIPRGEAELLAQAGQVLRQFHELPPQVKPWITQMVQKMGQGMTAFCETKNGPVFRLQSLNDVRRYCYVVAGVVGEALSRIVALVDSSFVVTEDVLERARQFGEFLQKVNILKDQSADEREGRFLVPNRPELWESARKNALSSFLYIESLPARQIEYRRFCAWSFFLGLETLRSIRSRGQNKVSQDVLAQVLAKVESGLVESDSSLANYFQELSAQIWLQIPQASS